MLTGGVPSPSAASSAPAQFDSIKKLHPIDKAENGQDMGSIPNEAALYKHVCEVLSGAQFANFNPKHAAMNQDLIRRLESRMCKRPGTFTRNESTRIIISRLADQYMQFEKPLQGRKHLVEAKEEKLRQQATAGNKEDPSEEEQAEEEAKASKKKRENKAGKGKS